jgi:hypothetical protein
MSEEVTVNDIAALLVQVVGVKRKPTAYPEVWWPQDEPGD